MDITVRFPELNDLDEISVIEKLSHPHPWTEDLLKRQLENLSAINLLMTCETGHVLSYIFSTYIKDEMEIHNIATHPDFRKKGYAKKIIRELINIAMQKKINDIYLEVRKSNVIARTLYSNLGFKAYLVRKKYYTDNNEDAVLMRYHIGYE